uniref:Uncharacterized protein n=1 Tax=Cacopsylla melanoneura TaxID=428564 RepID=A0A8D9BEJ1_9HEMI
MVKTHTITLCLVILASMYSGSQAAYDFIDTGNQTVPNEVGPVCDKLVDSRCNTEKMKLIIGGDGNTVVGVASCQKNDKANDELFRYKSYLNFTVENVCKISVKTGTNFPPGIDNVCNMFSPKENKTTVVLKCLAT